MVCGFTCTTRIYLTTMGEWERDSAVTRRRIKILRNAGLGVKNRVHYTPNCLECDRLFNQSEISV